MRLSLIRHTSLNISPGICYGQSDVDVSENFDDELQQLKRKLDGKQFDAIYSSPLQRCAKLAYGLEKGNIQLDHRLQELHFGDWELKPWAHIPRPNFDDWANNYANLSPPNGENFTQLHARIVEFFEEVNHHLPGKEVVWVTHGGVIRAMLAEVLNMPLKGLFRFHIDYASITQLDFTAQVPKVICVNR